MMGGSVGGMHQISWIVVLRLRGRQTQRAVAFKSQAPLQSSGSPSPSAAKGGDHKKSSGSCPRTQPWGQPPIKTWTPNAPISRSPQHAAPCRQPCPGARRVPSPPTGEPAAADLSTKVPDPRIPSPPQRQPAILRRLLISPIESNPNLSISRRQNKSNSRHHQPTPLRNPTIGSLEPRLSAAVKGRPALESAFAQTIAHDDAELGIIASPAA